MSVAEAVADLARSAGIVLLVEPCPPGRDREHDAGRRLARAALVAAGGAPDAPLARCADGRVEWPDGWTGSISHGAGWVLAGACVRSDGGVLAIGVDVEAAGALTVGDAAGVLTPGELAWVGTGSGSADRASAVWSAKEAAFKAWSTLAGGWPNPDPGVMAVDVGADGGWTARSPGRPDVTGRQRTAERIVVTVAIVRSTAAMSRPN